MIGVLIQKKPIHIFKTLLLVIPNGVTGSGVTVPFKEWIGWVLPRVAATQLSVRHAPCGRCALCVTLRCDTYTRDPSYRRSESGLYRRYALRNILKAQLRAKISTTCDGIEVKWGRFLSRRLTVRAENYRVSQ